VTEKEVLLGDISMLRGEVKRTRAELAALAKVVEDVLAWKAEREKPIEISIGDAFAKNEIEERARRAKALVANALRCP